MTDELLADATLAAIARAHGGRTAAQVGRTRPREPNDRGLFFGVLRRFPTRAALARQAERSGSSLWRPSPSSYHARQVVLRWHLQRGVTPIPKASAQKRIAENQDVFGFELGAREMAAIDALNRDQFALFDADELA